MAGNDNSDNNLFDNYAELVKRAKAGDESAFEEIYESTKRFVFVTSFEILKNEQDAEDVMQEVYLNLFKKIDTIKNEKALMRWLAVAAVNRSKDKIKYSKNEASYEDFAANEADITGDDDLEHLPDALILEKDKRDIFYKIMRKELSDVQFQSVLLYYYDQLDVSEIAQIMDCSKDTVKTRLKLARVRIKKGILEFEKTNKIKLLGGLAGAGNLGNFFSEFYRNTNIPAVKPFPVKIGLGTKVAAKTASKAAVKSAAGASTKAAAGTSLPKVLGIIGAAVLGIGVVVGTTLVIKNMAGDQNKESPTYETDYDDEELIADNDVMITETSVTDKPEPAETTGRVITVTDAVSETYSSFSTDGVSTWPVDYFYKIPRVDIEGVNTDDVNTRIMADLEQYHDNPYYSGQASYVEYVYSIDDDVVSVLVLVDEGLKNCNSMIGGPDIYFTYNISIDSGDLLEPEELIELRGLTDDKFFESVDLCLLNVFYESFAERYFGEEIVSPEMSYEQIKPFVSPEGHICVVAPMVYNPRYLINQSDAENTVLIDLASVKQVSFAGFEYYTDAPLPDENVSYNVTVYDADSGFEKRDYGKYKIPQIEIDGQKVDGLDSFIKRSINLYYPDIIHTECPEESVFSESTDSAYTYFVGDGFVSVCFRLNYSSGSGVNARVRPYKYFVFNISLENGDFLKPSDFIEMCGETDKDFFETAEQSGLFTDSGFKNVTFDCVTPFMSQDGHLCFVVNPVCYGGYNAGELLYDTVDGRIVDFA